MPAPLLSRRTTLGSALAAPLVLAACDIDPPRRASASDSPAATPPPPEDAALVAGVVTELTRARAVLGAAVTAVPELSVRLTPVEASHAAHGDVLAGAVPAQDPSTTPPAPRVPDQVLPALRAVRRSEQRLLRAVREACLASASGDLARVLASVAASTSQHLAALSTEVTS